MAHLDSVGFVSPDLNFCVKHYKINNRFQVSYIWNHTRRVLRFLHTTLGIGLFQSQFRQFDSNLRTNTKLFDTFCVLSSKNDLRPSVFSSIVIRLKPS